MQTFSLSAQFARESAMLKLPEERRRWGESKGAGRGREELLFCKGYYFYSPQSSTVIKSKMAATTILRTRTRFRPTKIRLHCRLPSSFLRRPILMKVTVPFSIGFTANSYDQMRKSIQISWTNCLHYKTLRIYKASDSLYISVSKSIET